MSKMVSGILARNVKKTPKGRGGKSVLFFPDPGSLVRLVEYKYNKVWEWTEMYYWDVIWWTLDRWNEKYDLKPPAPGKCFEVEIEL